MTAIELVWVISHDPSLQKRLPADINVVQSSCASMLIGKAKLPTLVIFDPDGFTADRCGNELASLRHLNPSIPVLIFSGKVDREFVFTLLGGGAKGYLLKSVSDARIHESLYELIHEDTPISAPVASILIKSFAPYLQTPTRFNLKKSEIEYLQLLSEGMTKKDISKKYDRSIHTVDNHVRKIYAKLNVKSVGEAVGVALRSKIIV